MPVQHERRWFADPTGQMTVRVWDTTACHREPSTAQAYEWTHVLDGSVTLTDEAGQQLVNGDPKPERPRIRSPVELRQLVPRPNHAMS